MERAEYSFVDFRRDNPKKCRADLELLDAPVLKGGWCTCRDGFYFNLESLNCDKCHSSCKFCVDFDENSCIKCPLWLIWNDEWNGCLHTLKSGQMIDPESYTTLDPEKCEDEACDVCIKEDKKFCIRCKFPYWDDFSNFESVSWKHSQYYLNKAEGKCIDCTDPKILSDPGSLCLESKSFNKKPVAIDAELIRDFNIDQRLLKISFTDKSFSDRVN